MTLDLSTLSLPRLRRLLAMAARIRLDDAVAAEAARVLMGGF